MLWLAVNAGYGAPNDTTVAWRQYPDTAENPVAYTLYLTNVTKNEPDRILSVPNIDDLDPSIFAFGYVIQGLTGGSCYSVTVTAEGGDLGVSYMSNNIQICPEIRTQLDASVKDRTTGNSLAIGGDGEITSIGFFHSEQHKCEAFYWSMSRTVGTGTDYYGFVIPNGVTMHTRIDLAALDGVIQARVFNVAFGGAGVTFTGKNYCQNIAGQTTPTIKAYEKVNTLTACSEANAVSPRLTSGTMTGGTPSGGKTGGSVSIGDADWTILGAGSYVLRLIGLVSGDAYDMTVTDYKHGAP
jgi:hypothetical protein